MKKLCNKCGDTYNEDSRCTCWTPSQVRPSRVKFYKSKEWKAMKSFVIALNPVCQICNKRLSQETDHVLPLRMRPDLALTLSNLQAVCSICHRTKTQSGW